MILGIELLRYFSALSILINHWLASVNSPVIFGGYGVALFFGISGYVIKSNQKNVVGFFLGRIKRIVPLYYFTTALFVLATQASVDFSSLATLFLSSQILTGEKPIYEIGWTLEYEFMFYFSVIGIFLLSKIIKIKIETITTIFFIVLFLSLAAFGLVENALYASCFFLGRMSRKMIVPKAKRFPISCILLAFITTILVVSNILVDDPTIRLAIFTLSIPVTLYIFSSLHVRAGFLSEVVKKLGSLTFGIYLWHMFAIKLIEFLNLPKPLDFAVVVLLTMSLSQFTYVTIENKFMKRKLL